MPMPVPSSASFEPRKGPGGDRPVYANQLSNGAYGRNYASIRPKTKPAILNIGTGGVPALPTAVAAQVDLLAFNGNPIVWEMYQNTAQTLLPRLVAGSETEGLEVGGDLVDNETVEYVFGGNHLANPYAYTVGTSLPVSFRVTLKISDVSGNDQLVMGWRKQQAYAAATAPIFLAASDPTYTDFAAMGFAAASTNPQTVRTITDLNDSGTPVVTSTGFTWADGETHTLEIRVSGRKAIYLINGIQSGTVLKDGLGVTMAASETFFASTPFNFDLTDVLVPFLFIRYDATAPGTIFVSPSGTLPGVEIGPLSEMGLDPTNRQL